MKERFIKESITKERFFLILIPQKNENRVLDIKRTVLQRDTTNERFYFSFTNKKTADTFECRRFVLLIPIQKHYTLLHFPD